MRSRSQVLYRAAQAWHKTGKQEKKSQLTQFIAHATLSDHVASQACCLLQVTTCTRSHKVPPKNDLFSYFAAHADVYARHHLALALTELVLVRHLNDS